MDEQNKSSEDKKLEEIDKTKLFDIAKIAKEIVSLRKRSLLLMFYDDAGRIDLADLTYLESVDCTPDSCV